MERPYLPLVIAEVVLPDLAELVVNSTPVEMPGDPGEDAPPLDGLRCALSMLRTLRAAEWFLPPLWRVYATLGHRGPDPLRAPDQCSGHKDLAKV